MIFLDVKLLDTLPTQPTRNIRSLYHLLTGSLILGKLFKRVPDMMKAPLDMADDTADGWDSGVGSIDGDAGEDRGHGGEGVSSAVVDEEGFEGVEGFEKPWWVERLAILVSSEAGECGDSATESEVLDSDEVVFDAGELVCPSVIRWLANAFEFHTNENAMVLDVRYSMDERIKVLTS